MEHVQTPVARVVEDEDEDLVRDVAEVDDLGLDVACPGRARLPPRPREVPERLERVPRTPVSRGRRPTPRARAGRRVGRT